MSITLKQAKRVAVLLQALERLEEWAEDLDREQALYVVFGSIGTSDESDPHETDTVQGELVLPKDIAIRMLAREMENIHTELISLGVTDSAEPPEASRAAAVEAL